VIDTGRHKDIGVVCRHTFTNTFRKEYGLFLSKVNEEKKSR
jgi:hypothetical protein